MKKAMLGMMLVAAVAFMFSGCKPKGGAEAGKEGAPAATDNATPGAGAEAAAPAGEVKTMEDLCKKYIAEMKAANKGGALPAEAEKQALESCMAGSKMMESMPKAKEMTEKYITALMKACEGKSGEEWVKCYASEGPKAMQESMK